MCTVGPNDKLWLTEVTGMGGNGFGMLNDGDFTLFSGNGRCCGSTWGPNEEFEILYLRQFWR